MEFITYLLRRRRRFRRSTTCHSPRPCASRHRRWCTFPTWLRIRGGSYSNTDNDWKSCKNGQRESETQARSSWSATSYLKKRMDCLGCRRERGHSRWRCLGIFSGGCPTRVCWTPAVWGSSLGEPPACGMAPRPAASRRHASAPRWPVGGKQFVRGMRCRGAFCI